MAATTRTTDRGTAYFPQLAAERLDIALCRASAAVARAADAHATREGIGVGQHLVLQMLGAVGPCSQQTLSEELRIDRSVMVGVCDDLERAGHVRRERNPATGAPTPSPSPTQAAGGSPRPRPRSPPSSRTPSTPSPTTSAAN